MVDYGMGWNHTNSGVGVFAVLMCLVVFVDLVLVGIWLYQQITKK